MSIFLYFSIPSSFLKYKSASSLISSSTDVISFCIIAFKLLINEFLFLFLANWNLTFLSLPITSWIKLFLSLYIISTLFLYTLSNDSYSSSSLHNCFSLIRILSISSFLLFLCSIRVSSLTVSNPLSCRFCITDTYLFWIAILFFFHSVLSSFSNNLSFFDNISLQNWFKRLISNLNSFKSSSNSDFISESVTSSYAITTSSKYFFISSILFFFLSI